MTNIARVDRYAANRVSVEFDYNLGAELVFCADRRGQIVLVSETYQHDAAPLSAKDKEDALVAAKKKFDENPFAFQHAA